MCGNVKIFLFSILQDMLALLLLFSQLEVVSLIILVLQQIPDGIFIITNTLAMDCAIICVIVISQSGYSQSALILLYNRKTPETLRFRGILRLDTRYLTIPNLYIMICQSVITR